MPVQVHEWSIWVGHPTQPTWNTSKLYRNAMPAIVGTSRTTFEGKDLAGKFPVAPISIVQFQGEPHRDVDVEVRAKKGTILSHWPASTERGGRLQWFGSDLANDPPADGPESYLPEAHWFQKLRASKASLFLKQKSHFERFIAYDTEVALPIPLKLRGGPDEYTLQNQTNHRLLDVAVIAPTEDGFRVGWLDELPTAVPAAEKKKDEPSAKKSDKQKADGVFQDAEKTTDEKDRKDELPPLPAEGDENVRAQVDQLLNRPITVAAEKTPRRAVLDLIAVQARLRYELDDRALAKAEVDLSKPTSLKAAGIAARDALADLIGDLGLSYRVTEEGKLYLTTSTRLADDGKKGGVIVGPPVKLLMSQPILAANASYREMTRDALTRRLAAQGLRDDLVQLLLNQYGKDLFEPGELIVLAHLSREALDETVSLDVFPPPKTLVRSALLVVHGIDPRLQDRARVLVQQLGDKAPKTRESAEARLREMGPAVVPILEDALTSKDLEVVFRAERLLLRLNRPVP
ncbi:MAG: hypothetical protein NVSMB9_34810 [Isosphaeraceae bacterium]